MSRYVCPNLGLFEMTAHFNTAQDLLGGRAALLSESHEERSRGFGGLGYGGNRKGTGKETNPQQSPI